MGDARLVRPRRRPDLLWASRPGTRHSRNIAARPEVAAVVYDSTVVEGEAEALYLEATAGEVDPGARPRLLAVYAARARARDLGEWTADRVTGAAEFRFYRPGHGVVPARRARRAARPAAPLLSSPQACSTQRSVVGRASRRGPGIGRPHTAQTP